MNNTVQLNNKKSIKDSLSIIIYSVLFLAIVLFLRSQLPGFFSPSSVYSILRKIASISLAAAGLTIVVIIGK